ncbi:hypothetical protein HDV02_005314 [Globomyces sp. JEL0801]|nr:hypothetical protein HDV02_005314 [Globomyces sp. JEL0801]
MATLTNRLKTIKRPVPPAPTSQYDDKRADLPLYLAVLQAVLIPVLEATPAKTTTAFKNSNNAYVQPLPNSIVKGDTIFLCSNTMYHFKQKIAERANIFKQIPTEDAKLFTALASPVISKVLNSPTGMTDLKILIDHLAFTSIELLKNIKGNSSPAEIDESLNKAVEMFLSILKESLLAESGVLYEVRNHQLLHIQSLRPIISKYFLTASQVLQDDFADMLLGVRTAFNVSPAAQQGKVQMLMQNFNEGSVFGDMKAYLDSLARGDCLGYQKNDFNSEAGYQTFRDSEVSILTGIMKVFSLRYPKAFELSRTAALGRNIPSNPSEAEKYYRALLQFVVGEDIKQTDGNILISKLSKSILSECALRWRISKEFREVLNDLAALFEYQVKLYRDGTGVALEDLVDNFKTVRKLSAAHNLRRKSEINIILRSFVNLREPLERQLKLLPSLVHRRNISAEDCENLLKLSSDVLQQIFTDPLYMTVPEVPQFSLRQLEALMEQQIKAAIVQRTKDIVSKVESTYPKPYNITERVSTIFTTFSKDLKKYSTCYHSPLLKNAFIHIIAAKIYVEVADRIIDEIENLDNQTEVDEVVDLYKSIRELYDYCEECSVTSTKESEVYFIPIMTSWLTRADSKWLEWAQRAYRKDEENGFPFILSPSNLNSASVIDIFKAFQDQLSFLDMFRFKDPQRRAMSTALEKYCTLHYQEFDNFKQNNAQTVRFFTREHVVKCNNILCAQKLYDDILETLNKGRDDFDEIAKDARRIERKLPTFKIKIIGAKNLQKVTGFAPKAFATINFKGEDYFPGTDTSTRTRHPIWNSYYVVEVPERCNNSEKMELEFSVLHDNSVLGQDVEIGKGSIHLQNAEFESFLSQNITLSLKPKGTLTIRLLKLGEIDDVNWYMQRTQEKLRFAIEDMIQTFVSNIIGQIDKGVTKLVDLSTESGIAGFFGFKKVQEVNDINVENGLTDVLQYIDHTLGLMNESGDRRFDKYVRQLYPDIGKEQGKDDAGDLPINSIAQIVALRTTIRRALPKGWTKKKRGEIEKHKDTYNRVPLLIHLLWHRVLVYGFESVNAVKEKLGASEITRVRIIESTIELIKGVFHCKVGRVVYGIPIAELDTRMYIQLRELLDQVLK